jgi:hypothetical protein
MLATDEIRNQMVSNAKWAIEHTSSIHYEESRPMPINIAIHHLPITTDCSGFATMMAKWAGAPDPNGRGYDGSGFTGSLLSHLPHIGGQDAKRGDFVVLYKVNGDLADGDHVVILLQDVAGHPDPFVASHGREDGPSRQPLSLETSSFTGKPATFLRTVYDCQRHEASGNSSLDWVANHRGAPVATIIHRTRSSHKHGQGFYGINDASLAKFNEYVLGGTGKKMRKVLVFTLFKLMIPPAEREVLALVR